KTKGLTKETIGVLGVLVLASLGTPHAATADEVFDWNVTGFEVTAEGGQNAIMISRTMTMMHLAVHDALNAIERRYEPYLYEGRAEPGAAPAAAVAAAARDVLVEVIPGWGKPEQREKALGIVDSAYASALAKVPDGQPKDHGIAIGKATASLRSTPLGRPRDSGDLIPTPPLRTPRYLIRLSPRATGRLCSRSGLRSPPSRWLPRGSSVCLARPRSRARSTLGTTRR